MTECEFADVSEYQRGVDDSYPHQFFSFRSNDGSYRDSLFAHNYAWACRAADSGKITGFLVYYVWRDSGSDETHADMIAAQGGPHPKCASMQDVESWGGQMGGDHSGGINASRENLIASMYGGNRKRVINYANEGDRDEMCPDYGDTKWVIANYSYNPNLKDQIAHQYSSTTQCAPFGPCDANSAGGYSPAEFAAALGLTGQGGGGDSGGDEDMGTFETTVCKKTQALTNTWKTLTVDDDGSQSWFRGPCTFQAQADFTVAGVASDSVVRFRWVTVDVRPSDGYTKPDNPNVWPAVEVPGTSGSTYGQVVRFGQIGTPADGYQRRLRLQAYADTPSGVSLSYLRASSFRQ